MSDRPEPVGPGGDTPSAALEAAVGGASNAAASIRKRPVWRHPGVIAGAIVAVLLISGLIWLNTPPSAQAYEDPVASASRNGNAVLATALLGANISTPFVDANDERAYVAYDYSTATNGTLDPTQTQRYVIGATASAFPDSPIIVVVQYIDSVPATKWTLQSDDFRAFMLGLIDVDALDERIEIEPLAGRF